MVATTSTSSTPSTTSPMVIRCIAKNTGDHARFTASCTANMPTAAPRPRAPQATTTIASAKPIST